MTDPAASFITSPMEAADARTGFRSGVHPLDDYFARHAFPNDQAGIGRAFVFRRRSGDPAELPMILGFYTLSMADVASTMVAGATGRTLPRYDMPVARIGRLAIDERAQRRGFGEALLLDALNRIVATSATVGCVGVVVDAKDDRAKSFYEAYGFASVEEARWPQPMFMALETARAALTPPDSD